TKAMEEVGMVDDDVDDIAVALTEASTNVLKHAGPGDEYEVSLEVEDDTCTIRVVDKGHGFDSEFLGLEHADASAEQGRGIELMRAVVDRVRFISKAEAGTIVHLEKSVAYGEHSVARGSVSPS